MIVTERSLKTARHTSFYLSSGRDGATPIIFVHGWPELSQSWRHQLPTFANLGFRAVAPDMRGYGRSSIYSRHEDYAVENIVADMIELIDSLGAEKAVWVGHDWGSPIVWSLASHHPDRCHGVANLCVPYIPGGLAPENLVPLVDRALYPESEFPAGQWDYMYFYRENFDSARMFFEHNVTSTVKALFRRGNAEGKGKPAGTAYSRASGGILGPIEGMPDMPRDESVLTEEDLHKYASGLIRNGFFGPDSWYMNSAANTEFAKRAKNGGRIDLPVLFLHAEYDWTCLTIGTRLADPMRETCRNLTEATVESGHWMAQEKPIEVNADLARWLAAKLPEVWIA